jgi:rsbT antagonist protein RsbS
MHLEDRQAQRIPILKIGDCLLISIQVDLHDRIALALQDELTNRIVETGATGVLIDISALEMIDSFIGRVLGTISSIARLLSANTVLVGMRPAIAITMLELGVRLERIHTALDVEDGLALLQKLKTQPKSKRAGARRKARSR